MKPNFALSLSFDGIQLLHRAAGGWRVVGDVALDADDLASELAVLRKTATALEPGGLRCKLLIPNAQIRYLTVDTADMSDKERRAKAREALRDATPYDVDDLVFDISADGPRTHVAAVARETLIEAEDFATEHRFHPVSFAAVPDDKPYLGEPFFGATAAADSLLDAGEKVEPDGIAVVVIGTATVQAAGKDKAAEPDAPAKPSEQPPTEPDPVPQPDRPDAPTPPVETPPEPEPAPMPEDPTPKTPPSEDPGPDRDVPPEAPQPHDPEPDTPKTPADPEPAPVEAPPPSEPGPTPAPSEAPMPQDPPAPTLSAAKGATAPRSREASAQVEATTPPKPDPVVTPSEAPTPQGPPAPTLSAAKGASTPRSKETLAEVEAATPPKPDPMATPSASPRPQGPPAPTLSAVKSGTAPHSKETLAEVEAPSLPRLSRPAKSAPLPVNATPAPPDVPPANSAATPVGFASRRAEPGPVLPSLGGARRDDAAPVPARSGVAAAALPIEPDSSSLVPDAVEAADAPASMAQFLSRRRSSKKPPQRRRNDAAIAVAPAGSEAERMTIFGARRAAGVGGKPRFLGLILTAALLVFLAGVAAWASVFLDDGLNLSRLFGDRAETRRAAAPDATPDPDTKPTFSAPAVAPVAPATADTAVEVASLEPDLTAEDGAVLDALRAPVLLPPEPPTQAEIEAKYAVTGIWPLAPEVPPEPAALIGIDDLYLTSIDPVSTTTDAVALPGVEGFASDTALASVTSPVAAGTAFARDGRGLIVPTADGALSPDGYTVFAGRPAIMPPATPARLEKAPEVDGTQEALAGLRPLERPGDLVETNERAQLDGLTRSELADLRPVLRPQSLQQQAEAEAEAEIAAVTPTETDAAVTAALATPPAIDNATQYAVTASRRPDTRPGNFARIVKRAERTAAQAAPAPTQVASAAAVAPRVVAPAIPSKTSVAKQATVKNAINLRKVNLIGVYGKPSNRRALVRLGNGRYQKVVVGDRIDGGRVSAIGDSELRYTKGGRNHVLAMPKG